MIDILKKPVELVPLSKLTIHPFSENIYKAGELDTLIHSMKEDGQLHEILYDVNYRIISGRRRYEAAKEMNMTHLKGRMIDTIDETLLQQIIIVSNQYRKKTFKEEVAEAKHVLGLLGVNQGKKRELIIDEKDVQFDGIKSDRFAIAAKYCGGKVSGATLRKAIAIDEFEYKYPDNELKLVKHVDEYQLTISKAYDLMKAFISRSEENDKVKGEDGERANTSNLTDQGLYKIIHGDCFAAAIEDDYIDVIGTSIPYFNLRDYRTKEEISAAASDDSKTEFGQEKNINDFIENMVRFGNKFYAQLKTTGSFFLNVGPTYSKRDNFIVPHRIAVALCDKVGFHLVNEIVIEKSNALPQASKRRLQPKYEIILHFVKDPEKYHYKEFKVLDEDNRIKLSKIRRPNNRGGHDESDFALSQGYKKFNDFISRQDQADIIKHCSVSHESTKVKREHPEGEHPGMFSTCLMLLPILTTSNKLDVFYDPFGGTGSSLITAILLGRKCIMTEKQERFVRIASKRLEQAAKEHNMNAAAYIENIVMGKQIIDITDFEKDVQSKRA